MAAETAPLTGPASASRLDVSVPILLYLDEWGGVGGTAGYAMMLARALRQRGYPVAAVCHSSEAMNGVRGALAEADVEVHTIEADGDVSVKGRLRRHRAFAGTIRAHPGSVLVLIMGYFTRGGGMTLAAKQAGAGAVVRADLTPPEPPISFREKVALWFKDALTDRVVVGAIENREAFARVMGRRPAKVDVVNTGIELDRFVPGTGRAAVRDSFGYGPADLVVGTVSRLDDERKGLDDFLEMAARTVASVPDAQFLIVGDGVLRPRLEERAAVLGISERVTFAGWRADVPAVLAAMDVFVMPSLFEGGPTSLLEAMAMRMPVVASRVGMVPEVIADGGNGLIVPPGDSSALAEATMALLLDDELRARTAAAARETALERFSIERMADGYLGVFAKALAARTGRRA
ncbi:MAG: glycosyltransferase family 4 protein [Dehalococcoidia bacterium]